MAKCTLSVQPEYTLVLTEKEAKALKIIVGSVTGNSERTWSGLMDGIYEALSEAGVVTSSSEFPYRGAFEAQ